MKGFDSQNQMDIADHWKRKGGAAHPSFLKQGIPGKHGPPGSSEVQTEK